jgi:hypothetical protein
LVHSGDKYALVRYELNDASLDEIEAFLASDTDAEPDTAQGGRRADLRAMLKAERALLVQMAESRETDQGSRERASTEAALAEIRRRISELQTEMGHKDRP